MKLQILVPQYKEPDEIVKRLLDSIEIQQSIDMNEIGVVICNDGSDVFISDELLGSYSFNIEYHKEPHRGVSGTRNACIQYSSAEYVMFCDADDMFFNACGIWLLFCEMENGFDSLVSAFLEETRDQATNSPVYIVRKETDQIFVHGKIYRREFLIENGLMFNESLLIHEDSYFNTLCLVLSENVRRFSTPFYLWKWRDDSVCRHDPEYDLKTYSNLIDNRDCLISELLDRGYHKIAAGFMVSHTFDAYYTMNKQKWLDPENIEYRESTERRFSEWFRKYEFLWDDVPTDEKMDINMHVRSRNVGEGMGLEIITIYDWIDHILSIQDT